MKAKWNRDATYAVLDDVAVERQRHTEDLWGIQHHPDGTNENWKVQADHAREKCKLADKNGMVTWLDILKEEVLEAFAEREWPTLRKELVQSAAVIVAWVEDGDSRK